MHILIDAYNVLYRKTDHISANQRNKFEAHTNKYIKNINATASIIYDGGGSFYSNIEKKDTHLYIIYTGTHINADQYILKEINLSKHPENFLIVSYDKEITSYAHSKNIHTLDPDDFLELITPQKTQHPLEQKKKNSLQKTSSTKNNEIDILMEQYTKTIHKPESKSTNSYQTKIEKIVKKLKKK